MDLTSLLSTFLSAESITGVSQNTGASQQEVQSVLSSALPLLLNGANEQAQDENSGFAAALEQHAADDTSDIPSFFSGIDMLDGAKIIAHLLGINNQTHTQSVAQQTGVSSAQTGSILAAAAPLFMSLMGQQTAQHNNSGLGIGGLIGSLFGGSDIGGLAGNLLDVSAPSAEQDVEPIESTDDDGSGILGLLSGLLGK